MKTTQLIIESLVALGTIGAVLVALFGQAFRAKYFPPRLQLHLFDTDGDKTSVVLTPPGQDPNVIGPESRPVNARYYHLRVSNSRRWATANQVQIVLLRLEEVGADGLPVTTWTGDMPFNWRHQNAFPASRSVGPDAYADLLSVLEGKWIRIETAAAPNNLTNIHRNPVNLFLSVQARSNEGDSPVVRLQVAWDGKWSDDTVEMRRHLVIKKVEYGA